MSRDITLLHPELQIIADKFLTECKKQGLSVLITETWRSQTEQDKLYAQGRTTQGNIVTNCKYPQSPHCWGVAFDFCRNVKGQEYSDNDGFFKKVGAIGKSLGLAWGGDWTSFVDKPHLELAKYLPNNSVSSIQKLYGTPEKFRAAWPYQKKEENEVKSEMIFTVNNGPAQKVESILNADSNYPKLRPLMEALGIKVEYDNATSTVKLTK